MVKRNAKFQVNLNAAKCIRKVTSGLLKIAGLNQTDRTSFFVLVWEEAVLRARVD